MIGCSTIAPDLREMDAMTTSFISKAVPGDSGIDGDTRQNSLASHPRLQAMRQEILSVHGKRIQETLWANPRIETEWENLAGDKGGLHGSEFTISLSQEIPLNGVLTWKEQTIRKEEEEAQWRYQEELFSLLSDVYLAYHLAMLEEYRDRSLRKLVDIATNFAEKLKEGANLGKIPKSDFLKAEVSLVNAKIKLNQAETNKSIAKQRLASLLLCDESKLPVWKESDLPEVYTPSWAQLQSMIQEMPSLKKLESAQSRIAMQKSQVQRERWPNPEVTVGGRRNYEENQNTLLLGIGLSLPVWNRNQGSIYELDALLEKNIQEQKNAKLELEKELFASHKKAVSSKENLEKYRLKALPAVEEAFQMSRQGYEEGKVSILEVILAQQAQLEIQLEYWQEAENFYTAMSSIFRLVGPGKIHK